MLDVEKVKAMARRVDFALRDLSMTEPRGVIDDLVYAIDQLQARVAELEPAAKELCKEYWGAGGECYCDIEDGKCAPCRIEALLAKKGATDGR